MTGYLLPPFGKINLNSLQERYEAKIEAGGREVELDLIFEKIIIEKDGIDKIKIFH